MARASYKQSSFSRGEAAPTIHDRQDTEFYFNAAALIRNFVVDGDAIAVRRPGTANGGHTKNDGYAALVPFVYDVDTSYMLEFGDGYFRAWYDGGLVLDGGSPFEDTTPYSVNTVDDLSYVQSRDVMWIAHFNYRLKKVERTSASTFNLSDFTLNDGPYLETDGSGATISPAGYGSVSPKMTSNVAPSGTVDASAATSDAWKAFDKDADTYAQTAELFGWISYEPASAKVCDGYFVRAGAIRPDYMISTWTMEGWNGSSWVILDSQVNQTGFGPNEARYFQIGNKASYSKYRIKWNATGNPDIGQTVIGEIDFHVRAENQVASNFTFSDVSNVNGGAGFDSGDIDRHIRVLASDGRWRWCHIVGVTSSTVVQVKIHDQSLPTLTDLSTWRLGVFHQGNYPAMVTFHENRLVLASQNHLYLSFSGDWSNFSPSDPDGTVNPDNGIDIPIPAVNAKKGAISDVSFAQSVGFQIVVGTPAGLHSGQSSSFGEGMKADSHTRRPQDSRGAVKSEPIVVGESVIYPHVGRQKLMGTYYRDSYDRIGAQDLSKGSRHITQAKIAGVTWQEEPHSVAWVHMDDGAFGGLTIQPEEKVQAWHSHRSGGYFTSGGVSRHAFVESMASIPRAGGGDSQLGLIVKRTINGATVRNVEFMRPYRQLGEDPRDAWFLDCALKYEGNTDAGKTITFTGSGVGDRTGTTNFTTPLFTAGKTLLWHDGARWHHGTITAVGIPGGGSYTFTWRPTKPNAGPGSADGRWHYIDGAWVQLTPGSPVDIYAATYVEPVDQTAIARWSEAVTSLSGLSDYEGQVIDLLLDGTPYRSVTVSAGAVADLPPFHVALAGFPYESRIDMLPVEVGSQNGSAQGKQRPIYEVAYSLLETYSAETGTGAPSSYRQVMEQFDAIDMPRDGGVISGEPAPLFTGRVRFHRDEQGDNTEPKLSFRVTDPTPATLRGVIERTAESDGR